MESIVFQGMFQYLMRETETKTTTQTWGYSMKAKVVCEFLHKNQITIEQALKIRQKA